MSAAALRRALWAEEHAAWYARLRRAKPVLPVRRAEGATVLGPAADRGEGAPASAPPLLVHLSPAPGFALGTASVLAAAIGGIGIVPDRLDAPIADAVEAGRAAGADPTRLALVGEGAGAAAALAAAAAGLPALRLVLFHPDRMPDLEPIGLPATFLQVDRDGEGLGVARGLELDLREAGVAVREVEVPLPDGWTRHPNLVRGSGRTLDDVSAFLKRGFGTEGTFGVIPSWNLS